VIRHLTAVVKSFGQITHLKHTTA